MSRSQDLRPDREINQISCYQHPKVGHPKVILVITCVCSKRISLKW